MELWAVSLVRDEMDVLPHTIAHLVSEGVDGFIIADNRSVDGTYEWLQDMAKDLGPKVVICRDDEIGYYQSRKMSALAADAFERGADWVIPFDADEVWYSTTGRSIAEDLTRYRIVDVLEATLHNYFPCSLDPADDNPFQRITWRDPDPAPLAKVLVRRPPGETELVIAQGNHDAAHVGSKGPFVRRRSPITVGHFPWRSPEQFERKVRNGYEAYRATDLPEAMGAHWRDYGTILETHGPHGLREVYDTWFHDPDMTLQRHPVPWCTHAG